MGLPSRRSRRQAARRCCDLSCLRSSSATFTRRSRSLARATAVLGERNNGAGVGWAAMSRHRWQRTLVPLSQPVPDAGICVSPCLRGPPCEPPQPFLPLGALSRWIQLLPPTQEIPQPS